MIEPNTHVRLAVLEASLAVERLTSKLLGSLIEIQDFYSSKTLGNKSTALSFSQKINLLIDIGALDDKKRTKFQRFMEIRNQFMHNVDANSYTNCVAFIDGCQNYLQKNYPNDQHLDLEDQLKTSVEELCFDVIRDTAALISFVVAKQFERSHNQPPPSA